MIAVFAGRSLPQPEREASARVMFFPPAAQGEVLRCAKIYPLVVFVDAVPDRAFAPAVAEVRAAGEYAQIVGAGALGAIRAVDARHRRVRCVGTVAGWYRAGLIDEHGVLPEVDPSDDTASTISLADLRWVLHLGCRRGFVNVALAERLLADARVAACATLTWEGALSALPKAGRLALLEVARTCGGVQRRDALFAIRTALRIESRGGF